MAHPIYLRQSMLITTFMLLATPAPAQTASPRLVPRFDVISPAGDVTDWDGSFKFEQVPNATKYTIEVTAPAVRSCTLPGNRLTIGSPGGKFKRDFYVTPVGTAKAVVCSGGVCQIKRWFNTGHYQPIAGSGSACRISVETYTYQITALQSHYTDKTAFRPSLSKYEF